MLLHDKKRANLMSHFELFHHNPESRNVESLPSLETMENKLILNIF